MSISRVLIGVAVLLANASAFTGDDARQRTNEASAAREPIDRFVAKVIGAVADMPKERWVESCWTHALASGLDADEDEDVRFIRSHRDIYPQMVVKSLQERGFTVKEFELYTRSVGCDCAKPHKKWNGELEYPGICLSDCHETPKITVCW